jgi:hypothetical protein
VKVRNNFVSNSSSSSFIVAAKKEVCPCCGKSDAAAIDMFNPRDTYDGLQAALQAFRDDGYDDEDLEHWNLDSIPEDVVVARIRLERGSEIDPRCDPRLKVIDYYE